MRRPTRPGLTAEVGDGTGVLAPARPDSPATARVALRRLVAEHGGEVETWQVRAAPPGERMPLGWWRAEGFARAARGAPLTAPAVVLHARHLLGSVVAGRGVAVRLTEVEAYAGPLDPASHAFTRTARSELMYGAPGRLYVYRSYGIHLCANVVTGPVGSPQAVLLRAGEVVDGLAAARSRRSAGPDHGLARGPGNLAACLGLEPGDNGTELLAGGPVRLLPVGGDDGVPRQGEVVAGARVGVSRAADTPWRFHLAGEPSVSAYRRSPRADASTR